jgi:2-iminobutanoate/2-iminopropanoate deaminase
LSRRLAKANFLQQIFNQEQTEMHRTNPQAVHPPLGGYSHAIRVPASSELIFIAGQVGANQEGKVPQGVAAQTRQALANLVACLEAESLSARDIVRLTVYLTDARYIEEMREERRAVFGTTELPTSTLLIVSGLAYPDLLVEIDAIAARIMPVES